MYITPGIMNNVVVTGLFSFFFSSKNTINNKVFVQELSKLWYIKCKKSFFAADASVSE